jgi:protein phosphatase
MLSSSEAGQSQTARLTDAQINQAIQEAIGKANTKIGLYAAAYQNEAIRPGTTVTMALVYYQHAYIANVGDSRTYVWRDRSITQITKDHSLVAKLEEFGVIEKGQGIHHPNRHIISQALGTTKQPQVDLFKWKLRRGDKLLLCSDGLWQAFTEPNELGNLLDVGLPPSILCRQLVEEANRRDGSDNISAVVVAVNES